MRKMIRVPIHVDLWRDLLTTGKTTHVKVLKGIPESAEFTGSYVEYSTQVAYLFFIDESFDEIGATDRVPEFVPVLKQMGHDDDCP